MKVKVTREEIEKHNLFIIRGDRVDTPEELILEGEEVKEESSIYGCCWESRNKREDCSIHSPKQKEECKNHKRCWDCLGEKQDIDLPEELSQSDIWECGGNREKINQIIRYLRNDSIR